MTIKTVAGSAVKPCFESVYIFFALIKIDIHQVFCSEIAPAFNL